MWIIAYEEGANGKDPSFVQNSSEVLSNSHELLCIWLQNQHVMCFSLCQHPSGNLFASGQIGKDPFVCVWDSNSCEVKSLLQNGHQRGISAIDFSNDGTVNFSPYISVTKLCFGLEIGRCWAPHFCRVCPSQLTIVMSRISRNVYEVTISFCNGSTNVQF